MKYFVKYAVLLMCALTLFSAVPACGRTGDEPKSNVSQTLESSGGQSSQTTASVSVPADLSDATRITLSGSSASVEGKGAMAEGGVVTITEGGAYTASGSIDNGRIIVNAPGKDVTLALDGVDIACSYGSPLYIYKAGIATLYLAEGTENTLTDGNAYTYDDKYSSAAEEEPNACLYSKADLVIEGTGKLDVRANYDNGITSKDTLVISGSTVSVSAVDNGINGKDSNTIRDALVTVLCGGDAIRSTNDTDGTLGWIQVSDSVLELTAGDDGIQAETFLSISGGSYVLDCSDDAVHAGSDATISGGTFTVSAGDDAFHSDGTLTVTGGEINILNSYEGLEGTAVTVSGGTIRVVSSDDGVNAASGADGSSFGYGNTFGGSNSDSHIDISGGYLVVDAGGDGLDSNGSISMSGGTVIVSSTGQSDGALDYESSFALSGGVLFAAESGNMAQAPSEASQYTISIGFNNTLPAGTYVSLASQDKNFVYELPADVNHMVVSAPEFEGGAGYTVSYGGNYTGKSIDGICYDGTYSGGTALTELTLSDYVTSFGSQGFDRGGMGGRPGKDAQWRDRGELPPDRGKQEGMPEDSFDREGHPGRGGFPSI